MGILNSRNLLAALALLLLGGCFGGQAGSGRGGAIRSVDPLICNGGEQAALDRVVDGDTIDIKLGNGEIERVRLIGIDTPERGESCFAEATDYLRELLGNGRVTLIRDKSNRDRYGRLVRYVCSENDTFTEAALVREGLAVPYRYYPDTYYADYLQELGAEAAMAAKGCLFDSAMKNSAAQGSACCLICRSGKACGDVCIPADVTCRLPTGCACDG